MESPSPLGQLDPVHVTEFWQRFLNATQRDLQTPQPAAWPFGDSVTMADELLELVLMETKRATAGSVAAYDAEGDVVPEVGDFEIVTDGALRPRAVLQFTHVRIGPLSSVDDQFAFDEGEGDRTRDYWLAAHTDFFKRTQPPGVDFDLDMATVFQRFDLQYQED